MMLPAESVSEIDDFEEEKFKRDKKKENKKKLVSVLFTPLVVTKI